MLSATWNVEHGLIETPRMRVFPALLVGLAVLNIASVVLALLAS